MDATKAQQASQPEKVRSSSISHVGYSLTKKMLFEEGGHAEPLIANRLIRTRRLLVAQVLVLLEKV
jgi:hypothetical protein